jgi:hypothetical protein
LCRTLFLVLSFLSTPSIPWKVPPMEVAKTSTKIGSFHESLLLLGLLSTCLGAVLCVLLAVLALVLLDWTTVICFLELCTDEVLCVIVAVRALVLLDLLAMLCFLEVCADAVLCMLLCCLTGLP